MYEFFKQLHYLVERQNAIGSDQNEAQSCYEAVSMFFDDFVWMKDMESD